MDIKQEMEFEIAQLNRWTKLYDEGHPEISDAEWDKYYFRLASLEKNAGFALPNSPTQKIHYDVVNSLSKVEHSHPMLSLSKTKDVKDLVKFSKDNMSLLMAKMDGLTCSLTYEGGRLVRAETRGDGKIGEDITHNAMVIKSIPRIVNEYASFTVDGEVICTKNDFKSWSDTYMNERNFASGSIRLLDSRECSRRNLTFVAWETNLVTSNFSLNSSLFELEKLGFTVVPHIATNEESLTQDIEYIKTQSINYPIDGLVMKYDNIKYSESLGSTAHHPKNAIAYKFYDEEYETTLRYIDWTMGRTGVLTPVAVFDTIEIEGTNVNRASLHNISVMEDILGIPFVGQKITVAKANMIIPQVISAEILFVLDKEIIKAPQLCPICGQPIDVEESDAGVLELVCHNKECNGQLINKIDYYCGKAGMDIKGISRATLSFLLDKGWINKISDIYNLRQYKTEWCICPGWGPTSVEKILKSIEASTNCTLAQFLSAIGIPLIGKNVAKELTNRFASYGEFRNAIKDGFMFTSIPNFGGAKHLSIIRFNYDEFDEIAKKYLNIAKIEAENKEKKFDEGLVGKTFCITGKLYTYKNRDAFVEDITRHGGRVSGSVSKKTTALICNDISSATQKAQTAESLGIEILSEEEFIEKYLKS